MERNRRLAVALLLAAGVLGACGDEPPTRREVLTKAIVRGLLPEAASVDRAAVEAVARLGMRTTPADVGHDAALPLWALTPVVSRAWPPPEGGAAAAPSYTPRQAAALLADSEWSRQHGGRPTLLSPEYVKSVTIDQKGSDARGVVSFGPKGGFTGTTRYEATWSDDRWTITAFTLPAHGVRIVRGDGKWEVAELTPPPPPLLLTLPHADDIEAPGPTNTMQSIYVLPSGDLEVGDERWSLATGSDPDIRATLRRLAKTLSAGGEARVPAIVGDVGLRCKYTQWVLAAAARSGVETALLAARSTKDGAVGVVPVRPTSDLDAIVRAARSGGKFGLVVDLARLDPKDRNRSYTRVQIAGDLTFDLPRGFYGLGTDTDRERYDAEVARIREAVRSELRAQRGESLGVIQTTSPYGGLVPYGDVVRMIGVLREAGATEIWCQVEAFPD